MNGSSTKRETGWPAAPRPQSARRIDVVADRIDSRDLFIGTREIIILHGADSYRLRLTAQNKLILTK
ncbi:MAG: hemin uptake protein HemP [Variibacter sp.]|nr:hemin uptake protein HemP [Variibacter sp.]